MEPNVQKPLAGKVCIVTGGSRGIGKGVALQLGAAGAIVYIYNWTLKPSAESLAGGSLIETATEVEARGGTCIPVQCDHFKDEDVSHLFERVAKEQNGRLDILVNNAFAGITAIIRNIGKPFWELQSDMWEHVCDVGLRNHFICAVHAAKMMVSRRQGLIVNVSSFGGKYYGFNALYGVSKAGVDRMAADCGLELKPHNIAFVSLWPETMKTELLQYHASTGELDAFQDSMGVDAAKLLSIAASIEYAGIAIVQLAQDLKIMDKTGKALLTSELGKEYGFKDIDDFDNDKRKARKHSGREYIRVMNLSDNARQNLIWSVDNIVASYNPICRPDPTVILTSVASITG